MGSPKVCRVYAAGSNPGQDVGAELREYAGEVSENADLVGGARTAAGEHAESDPDRW